MKPCQEMGCLFRMPSRRSSKPVTVAQYPVGPEDGLSKEKNPGAVPTGVDIAPLLGGLSATADLHSIRNLRLVRRSPVAVAIHHGHTAVVALEALSSFPGASVVVAAYLNIVALMPAPVDRRLPAALAPLIMEVGSLRALLDRIRSHCLPGPWSAGADGDASRLPDSIARFSRLVSTYLQRHDWRERDLAELICEYLQEQVQPDGASNRALEMLGRVRQEDHGAYDLIMTAMVAEARGVVANLARARARVRQRCRRGRQRFGPRRFAYLVEGLAAALNLSAAATEKLQQATVLQPSQLWEYLEEEARSGAATAGHHFDLKNFEFASLYLLQEVKPNHRAYAGFVHYLLAKPAAYRRLLAAFYLEPAAQKAAIQEAIQQYNRLPEHSASTLDYEEGELEYLRRAIFLRPDVVDSIVNREGKKGLYHCLPGLDSRAYLPRVLHEVHNVFGHVTPEVFPRIVDALGLKPVEVIRTVASFQEFTADPQGDVIIHVCKGTACFLRGQPHLSRALSSNLGAVPAGKVSKAGVQYVEMDCFGVCHLAPVLKVGDTFFGNVNPEEIPEILQRLRQGRTYDNRVSFLSRWRQLLPPGEICPLPPELRPRQTSNLHAEVIKAQLAMNRQGTIFLLAASDKAPATEGIAPEGWRELGTLCPRSLSFDYLAADGSAAIGSLVIDAAGQVLAGINCPPSIAGRLGQRTLKPQAAVVDDRVVLIDDGTQVDLGEVNGNTIVLAGKAGDFASITFAGDPCRQPPEQPPTPRDPGQQIHPAAAKQSREDRLILGFAAGSNPEEIDSYIAAGGYQALQRVLGLKGEPRWPPERIIGEVSISGLRGRGGAGFPTGRKWEAIYRAPVKLEPEDELQAPVKLIVANGDEGDPGAFMDRTLIQERPHQIIEGMVIAALAVGARFGIIYLRKEYEDAVRRLEHAIFQARRRRYLGENILGIDALHFDLEIRLGAGAFVAGEKRAIMRAIEGKPAEPTLTAVSNVKRGLWGKPTLLNNVETFANIPLIIQRGGQWYRRQGHGASGGSKIFSVAGIVARPGLVEVRFGRSLRDIIDCCGGVAPGKILAGVQIGGPSGAILSLGGIRSYLLDTPLDFDTFNRVGAMLGSGGLVFLGADDDVVRLARHFMGWLAAESCGQCPACHHGTTILGEILDTVISEEAFSHHLHGLWARSDLIKAGSRCGLGRTAPNPVTSSLRFFPVAYLHYLLGNPQLDRLELFLAMEALHLLVREDVVVISGRSRRVVGHLFSLRKRFIPPVVAELEKIDRYRPPLGRRTDRFLHLLGMEPWEVGGRDANLEVDIEELERHAQCRLQPATGS